MSFTQRQFVLNRIAVDKGTGCWLCLLKPTAAGYVTVTVGSKADGSRRSVYMHRLVYELWVGPIPEDFAVRHLCCNRNCCNPEHLECGFLGESLIGVNADKTHCIRGHPFDEENTRIDPLGSRRKCRACERLREKKRNASKRKSTMKVNARKTHCLRGHAFDEQNTRFRVSGVRQCRECVRMREKKYRMK